MEAVATFAQRFSELVEDELQIQVCKRLSISRASLIAYKNGTRTPKQPVLKSIANEYSVDPVWLMGFDVPKHKEVSGDRAYLIKKIKMMDDDSVRRLRVIVDEILALRGSEEGSKE